MLATLTLIVFGYVLNVCQYSVAESASPSPIILVPGLVGCRAYANISTSLRSEVVKTEHLWVNYWYVLDPAVLTRYLKLNYNPITHQTTDMPNSTVFFPGWGSTETIENLDENNHWRTNYFGTLVQNLVKDKFYVRGKTLRGTPYDFRKSLNENLDFLPKLIELITDTYIQSGNRKVVILGHSMGCPYALYVLNKVSVEWKNTFIKSFICACGPLAGSVKSLELEVIGEEVTFLEGPIKYRDLERSFPSAAFLLPKPEVYKTDVLLSSAKRNYTSYDYEALFNDMDYPTGYLMYLDSKNIVDVFQRPEGIAEIYCIYGSGLNTLKQLNCPYFPDTKKCSNIYEDGDGTVSLKSFKVCSQWEGAKNITIKNGEHVKILSDVQFISTIKGILNY